LEYTSAQLTELYIHDVPLKTQQLQALSDSASSPQTAATQLTVLSLQNVGIDDTGLQPVLDYLVNTPSLKALLLDDNHIGGCAGCSCCFDLLYASPRIVHSCSPTL
jgi:hypothetical protein